MKRVALTLLVANGFGSVISAVSFIVLGRLGGVDAVAVLGTAASVFTFVFALAELGLTTFLLKSRALRDDTAVAVGLRLNVLSSSVFGAVAVGTTLVLAISMGVPWAVIPLAIGFAIEKNSDTAQTIAIADGRPSLVLSIQLTRRLIGLSGLLVLSALGVDALFAYAVAYAVGAIAGQFIVRAWLSGKVPRALAMRAALVRVARDSFPFYVNSLAGRARTLDVAAASLVMPIGATGLYAAASRISQPFYLIPSALAAALVPHSARQTPRQARRTALWLAAGFTSTCLVTGGVAFFLAQPLLGLLLGSEFSGAALALTVLMAFLPITGVTSPLESILQGQGHQHYVAVTGILWAIALVVFVILGALLLGPAGAALGVGTGYLGRAVTLVIRVARRLS